jgi:hypothetical protein
MARSPEVAYLIDWIKKRAARLHKVEVKGAT